MTDPDVDEAIAHFRAFVEKALNEEELGRNERAGS